MKKTKKQLAIEAAMNYKNASKTELGKMVIITYDAASGPAVIAFRTSHRPDHHWAFRTREEQSEYRETLIKKEQRNIEEDKARMQRAEEDRKKMQPGVILVTSWGWEQTNIDFHIVLERKNDFVIIQEIGQHREDTGFMQGTCTPNPDMKIGEPFRKKINKWGTINLESFMYTKIWEGQEQHWSSYA